MRHNVLTLAILAPLAAFTVAAHADSTFTLDSVSTTDAIKSYTYSFSDFYATGFQFTQLAPAGTLTGSLTSVSMNATLNASVAYTYADDLTIYVVKGALASGGALQVGGYSSLGAGERHSWGSGDSSLPGTTVVSTVTLTTPLSFAGTTSDYGVWLGNGYGDPSASGDWTGTVTLNFTVAAVPEPSTWALFALGGVGLVAWMARRRRADSSLG